jgi:hypothetical protein
MRTLGRDSVIGERLAVVVLGAGSIAQPMHLGLTAFLVLRGMQKRGCWWVGTWLVHSLNSSAARTWESRPHG